MPKVRVLEAVALGREVLIPGEQELTDDQVARLKANKRDQFIAIIPDKEEKPKGKGKPNDKGATDPKANESTGDSTGNDTDEGEK